MNTNQTPSRWPPMRLSQMLMLLLGVGILMAFWMESPAREPGKIADIEIGETVPLVAVYEQGVLRVVDAASGEQLYREKLGEADVTAAVFPLALRHIWPANWLWSQEEPPFIDAIELLSNGKRLGISVYPTPGGRLTKIIDLPSGKSAEWGDSLRNIRDGVKLVTVDEFVVAVQDRVDSTPLAVGGNDPKYMVTWACNPSTLEGELTEEQMHRAIAAYRAIVEPIDRTTPSVTLRHWEIENRPEEIEIGERRGRVETFWPLGNEEMLCKFHMQSYISGDGVTRSPFWHVDGNRRLARRVPWPFGEGEVFIETQVMKTSPLAVGEVRSPQPGGLGISSRYVAWDLASGKVMTLPLVVNEARQFGRRLLLANHREAVWFDLDTGRTQRVIAIVGEKAPGKYWAGAIWLLAWIGVVRPAQEGDQSRRFGLLLMLLAAFAVGARNLDSLGLRLEWAVMEWAIAGGLLLPLLGLVIDATVRRSASRALVGFGWALTLLLAVRHIAVGFTQVEKPILQASRNLNQTVSPGDVLWTTLTGPSQWEFNLYEPGIGPGEIATEYPIEQIEEPESEIFK